MTHAFSESIVVVAILSVLSVLGISTVYRGRRAIPIAINILIPFVFFLGAATFTAINGYGLDHVITRYIGEPIAAVFGKKTRTPEEFSVDSMKELEVQKEEAQRTLNQTVEQVIAELEAKRLENERAIEEAQKRVAEAQSALEAAKQRADSLELARREANARRSQDRSNREIPQVTYPMGSKGPPMIPFK